MQHYVTTAAVTSAIPSPTGGMYQVIDPSALSQFKTNLESHIQMLTTEMRILRDHANWIEPRLNDFHKFMTWMEQAHPDIIEAFKKSTEVAEKLDRANNNESESVQMDGPV